MLGEESLVISLPVNGSVNEIESYKKLNSMGKMWNTGH